MTSDIVEMIQRNQALLDRLIAPSHLMEIARQAEIYADMIRPRFGWLRI